MPTGVSVLVVEDDVLIALDLENNLVAAGSKVLGSVRSYDEAVRLATSKFPRLAIVDYHLDDGAAGVRLPYACCPPAATFRAAASAINVQPSAWSIPSGNIPH